MLVGMVDGVKKNEARATVSSVFQEIENEGWKRSSQSK
jgi:hypothetical protein